MTGEYDIQITHTGVRECTNLKGGFETVTCRGNEFDVVLRFQK